MKIFKFKKPKSRRVKKLRGYQRKFIRISTTLTHNIGFYELYDQMEYIGDETELLRIKRKLYNILNLIQKETEYILTSNNIRVKLGHCIANGSYSLTTSISDNDQSFNRLYYGYNSNELLFSYEYKPMYLYGSKEEFKRLKLI